MHLVDEQHGFLALCHQAFVGAVQHVAHILDAGCDGGKFFEFTAGLFGHDGGERGFAHAGRAEQDDGARCGERPFGGWIGEATQRGPLTEHMILSHHFVDGLRPHAHRQWSGHVFRCVRRTEQILLAHVVHSTALPSGDCGCLPIIRRVSLRPVSVRFQ